MNKHGALFGLLAVALSIVAIFWKFWLDIPTGANVGIDTSIYVNPRFWGFAGLLFITVYRIDTVLFHWKHE